jgi:hypothetical protein
MTNQPLPDPATNDVDPATRAAADILDSVDGIVAALRAIMRECPDLAPRAEVELEFFQGTVSLAWAILLNAMMREGGA